MFFDPLQLFQHALTFCSILPVCRPIRVIFISQELANTCAPCIPFTQYPTIHHTPYHTRYTYRRRWLSYFSTIVFCTSILSVCLFAKFTFSSLDGACTDKLHLPAGKVGQQQGDKRICTENVQLRHPILAKSNTKKTFKMWYLGLSNMVVSTLGSKKTSVIVEFLLDSQPPCGIIRTTVDYFLWPQKCLGRLHLLLKQIAINFD
jgi:hypothetical protein